MFGWLAAGSLLGVGFTSGAGWHNGGGMSTIIDDCFEDDDLRISARTALTRVCSAAKTFRQKAIRYQQCAAFYGFRDALLVQSIFHDLFRAEFALLFLANVA